jgi:hypothetical protein
MSSFLPPPVCSLVPVLLPGEAPLEVMGMEMIVDVRNETLSLSTEVNDHGKLEIHP